VGDAVEPSLYGVCADGNVGARCDANDDCATKHCFKLTVGGDFGSCTSGNLWDGCDANDDCESGNCDQKNKRCGAKK
jgi:hypothetical protein